MGAASRPPNVALTMAAKLHPFRLLTGRANFICSNAIFRQPATILQYFPDLKSKVFAHMKNLLCECKYGAKFAVTRPNRMPYTKTRQYNDGELVSTLFPYTRKHKFDTYVIVRARSTATIFFYWNFNCNDEFEK